MDGNTESYLLLLLADSNLPTGSFVASSGLESYFQHGFASLAPHGDTQEATTQFMRNSVHNFAWSSLAFVTDAWRIVNASDDVDEKVSKLKEVDQKCHCMMLNTVSRRASTSQGVALLTLYSKGYTKPAFLVSSEPTPEGDRNEDNDMKVLMDKYKLLVRLEETPGHLSTCWGMLCGALGLSLERTQYLHLFLHARSLLSASVRLNNLGPYASQQVLLHIVRPMIDEILASYKERGDAEGPATTWPLGELLQGRHDMLRSRIFNS